MLLKSALPQEWRSPWTGVWAERFRMWGVRRKAWTPYHKAFWSRNPRAAHSSSCTLPAVLLRTLKMWSFSKHKKDWLVSHFLGLVAILVPFCCSICVLSAISPKANIPDRGANTCGRPRFFGPKHIFHASDKTHALVFWPTPIFFTPGRSRYPRESKGLS